MRKLWSTFYKKINGDDVWTQAAALAFYIAVSIVPLFILLVSSVAILNINIINEMLIRTQLLVGEDAAHIFESVAMANQSRAELLSWGGVISVFILIISSSIIFSLAFQFLSDEHAQFRYSLLTGFLTAVPFVFGKDAISLYFRAFVIPSVYGKAGLPIALLAWLYYSALVVLLGAEGMSIYLERKNKPDNDNKISFNNLSVVP